MPLSSTSLVRCQVTTERMIRQQLQEQTGVDVSDRKAFIKQQVTRRWHTTFSRTSAGLHGVQCVLFKR